METADTPVKLESMTKWSGTSAPSYAMIKTSTAESGEQEVSSGEI